MENVLKELKESNQIECKLAKKSFPKEALYTYSAFANTEGGILILGIEEENGRFVISGVENIEKVKKEMFDTLNNPEKVSKNIITDDMVDEIEKDGKKVLIISIPKASYKDKPIYLNRNFGQAYKRNYEGDYRCSDSEVKAMIRDSSNETLDSTVIENFTIEDLDEKTLSSYRQRFSVLKPEHIFNELNNENFLMKIGAARKNRKTGVIELTMAGLLIFGKTEVIKEFLPYFNLEYIDKSNPQAERWQDRVIYDGTWGEGNLYNFFFVVIEKLYNSVEKEFKLDNDNLVRTEKNAVQIALREAFVNAIIHADFKIEESLKITRYPSYFQFENPGELRITKEEFFNGGRTKPRNNTIQDIFRFLNLCERAGSGVPKILKATFENSYKYPEIKNEHECFVLKFWNTSEIDNLKNITDTEKKILSYIIKHKKITNQSAREKIGLTKHEATYSFNSLLKKELIIKRGVGRGIHYIMNYSADKLKLQILEEMEKFCSKIKEML